MSLSEAQNQNRGEAEGSEVIIATGVEAALAELKQKVSDLERQLARGTGDHVEAAQRAVAGVAPPKPKPVNLRERVQTALMRESLNAPELARSIGEPTGKVTELLRVLRQEKRIYNVGLAESPLWSWRPGDEIDSTGLNDLVARLISERPMTTRELTDATGARMSRVGGAIVAIQRSGSKIMNFSKGHAGRWFLLSERAKDARLDPKKPKRV